MTDEPISVDIGRVDMEPEIIRGYLDACYLRGLVAVTPMSLRLHLCRVLYGTLGATTGVPRCYLEIARA